jgi:hypothetical protein
MLMILTPIYQLNNQVGSRGVEGNELHTPSNKEKPVYFGVIHQKKNILR